MMKTPTRSIQAYLPIKHDYNHQDLDRHRPPDILPITVQSISEWRPGNSIQSN